MRQIFIVALMPLFLFGCSVRPYEVPVSSAGYSGASESHVVGTEAGLINLTVDHVNKTVKLKVFVLDDDYAKKLGVENFKQMKIEPQGGAALIVLVDEPKEEGDDPEPRLAIVADWGEQNDKIQSLLTSESTPCVSMWTRASTSVVKMSPSFTEIATTTLFAPPNVSLTSLCN